MNQTAPSAGLNLLAQAVQNLMQENNVLVVGLTGSVASGKTTLAEHLRDSLSTHHRVESVSTDGFLFPNAVLAERDLMNRKGFPETYDQASMRAAIQAIRQGPADFPTYSHIAFDVDRDNPRQLERPDILILEGLGHSAPSAPPPEANEPDVLIYLDADTEQIENWFLERFKRFWSAAKDDPTSFYAQFLHMSEDELVTFARSVWANINLPNLTNHILPLKERAHIIVTKDENHAIEITRNRLA